MLFDKLPNREEAERLMGLDRFVQAAGMQVLVADPGYAEVALPVSDAVLNGHDKLHGGALFTLADYAAAIASNMLGEPTMAVNGSISFLRSVRGGRVLAKARTVKAGARMTFQTVDLHDDDGSLVATFQGSAMMVARQKK